MILMANSKVNPFMQKYLKVVEMRPLGGAKAILPFLPVTKHWEGEIASMNASGQSCSQSEEPQSLCLVLSLHLEAGKTGNCYPSELVPETQKGQVKRWSSALPATPQNKIGLSAVFSWTQEVKRLRNLGYSLFATALSTEAGAHPPGFTAKIQ